MHSLELKRWTIFKRANCSGVGCAASTSCLVQHGPWCACVPYNLRTLQLSVEGKQDTKNNLQLALMAALLAGNVSASESYSERFVEAFPSDMASTWFEALHDAVEGRSDAATASHSSLRHHRGGAL